MLSEQFEERYIPVTESGCWLWTGATSREGYGSVRFNGSTKAAHRVSYEIHKSEIPKGMHILHKCDVPCCVNPNHLEIGSNYDNIIDSMKKGRRKGITRKRPSGLLYKPMSEHGKIAHMKVKPNNRTLIKDEYLSGQISLRALGKKYGVSNTTIFNIVKS